MAINPSLWSKVLTIPESYVPGVTTSGQTLVITEAVIAKLSAPDQAVFWSTVLNGGGDIRICLNSDGTNQLPVEVVSCDNIAETCVIWTRKASYDGTGDLYLFIGKAGETQPPVTDALGRNAVWIDRTFVSHCENATLIDSSGNVTSGVIPNAITETTGNIGGALSFNGTSSDVDLGIMVQPTNDFKQSIWIKTDKTSGFQGVVGNWTSTSDNRSYLGLQNAEANFNTYSSSGSIQGGTINTSDWFYIVAKRQGSTVDLLVNGVQVNTDTNSDNPNPALNTFLGGLNSGTSNFFDGLLSEVDLAEASFSDEQILAEYENQSSPATFFGTPTLDDTAGAAGVIGESAFDITKPIFSASGAATLPQPIGAIAFDISKTLFSGLGSATTPRPIGSGAFTLTAPTFAGSGDATLPQPIGNIAFTLGAPTFSGQGATIGFEPIGNITFDISNPSFSASGSATLPNPVGTIGFTIDDPIFDILGSQTGVVISYSPDAIITVNSGQNIIIVTND